MTLQLQSWEHQLLTWAHEPLSNRTPTIKIQAENAELDNAYHCCETITRTHSRTFYAASGLLPQDKRRAARALYAFCRITDNIVDDVGDIYEREQALMDWRDAVMSPPNVWNSVLLAWADTQARFNIPSGYTQQLIDGVARDLRQTRYETFADLAEYSYGVASTVGLMAMHIIGYTDETALPYAIKLGVALQLTNILRDVAEDFANGRLYLPAEELSAFRLCAEDIENGVVNNRWREFMRFQIERNRRLYAESRPGIALLDANGRFAITAAADLYQAILDDIERHDYNVFYRRAHVGMLGKLRRLPSIWWYSRSSAAS